MSTVVYLLGVYIDISSIYIYITKFQNLDIFWGFVWYFLGGFGVFLGGFLGSFWGRFPGGFRFLDILGISGCEITSNDQK